MVSSITQGGTRRQGLQWGGLLVVLARLLCGVCVTSLPMAFASPAAPSELDLQAEVIHRVMLFVHWPADRLGNDAPLELCVLDDGPLSQALQRLQGREVNGHVIQVRKAPVQQVPRCHAAFVGNQASAVLALPMRRGVLILGDQWGLIEQGAMLNIQRSGDRIVFDIGLSSARQQEMEIGVKLLRLARYVKEN